MSRLWQVFKKNLLLLIRSKSSAFMILFGPLFIILLVGLAFTGSSSYELALGYYAPESSPLVDRFVENMQGEGFTVEQFLSVEECTARLKQGSLQACMAFPPDFAIQNNKTNEIVFYVDESRTNFVYQIIESVSSNLGVESAELSKDLTNDILEVLWRTEEGIDDALAQAIRAKAGISGLLQDTEGASSATEGIDLENEQVETQGLEDDVDELSELLEDLQSSTGSLLSKADTLVDELEGASYSSEAFATFSSGVDSLRTTVTNNEDDAEEVLNLYEEDLDTLKGALDEMEEKLSEADDARGEVLNLLGDVKREAQDALDDLDALKAKLESLTATISNLRITSSDTISKPIVTKIEYLSSKSSKLSFMFPYLLMLVVMFIGLLLSGTLIIMEKKSKSSFRTFCTPTSDSLFMIGNFLTTLAILFVQLGVLLALAYYFIGDLLISNLNVALGILFLGVVFFILLGMAVGYVLSSQEAVTMISISLGSIFLFLSNLVLPLETLSSELRAVTAYNPYVMTSEALRRALLFGTPFDQLYRELAILAGYSVAVLLFILVARRLMRSTILARLSVARRRKIFDDPADMYLMVGKNQFKNLKDLLKWLQGVDDKTFTEELTWKEIREWMILSHQSKWLRVRLAGKGREKMVEVLQAWLEKNK